MSTTSLSTLTNVTTAENGLATETAGGSDELGRDAFLRLLVTQLQYQDPLEPTKNEAFVAQLAQFSQVEQLTTANAALESLYAAMASMNNASMTQLLGKSVLAQGDTFYYGGDGDHETHWDSEADATSATVTISDSDGHVVYSTEIGGLEEGRGSWTWDGQTISGGTAEDGEYTFTVTALNRDGDSVDVMELVEGEIDGMSYETGTPVPSIHGVEISLGDILEVSTGYDRDEDDEEPTS